MSPHIVKASYTGARSKGQSAARLARYIEERRTQSESRGETNGHEQKQNQERGRYEKATTFGSREEFVAAAKERAGEGRRSSYVHVILSPQEGREFTDRDFEKLLKPWTQDRHGNEKEYFAAVHRDSEHPHLHVAVARDKFGKEELSDLKSQTHERIRGRERFHEGETERGQEREQSREQGERGSDLGRYARQGMREARYIGTTIARKAAQELHNELGGNDHTQVQWGGYGQNGPSRLKVRIGDREIEIYGGRDQSKREMMERAREHDYAARLDEQIEREQQKLHAEEDRRLEEAKERRREEEEERERRWKIDRRDPRHDPVFDPEEERPQQRAESERVERSLENQEGIEEQQRDAEQKSWREQEESSERDTASERDTEQDISRKEEYPEDQEQQRGVPEDQDRDEEERDERDPDERDLEEQDQDFEEREESSAEAERDEGYEDGREPEQEESEEREAEDYIEQDLSYMEQGNSLQQNNMDGPMEGPGSGLQEPGGSRQGTQEQNPSQERGGNERGGSGDRSR